MHSKHVAYKIYKYTMYDFKDWTPNICYTDHTHTHTHTET